MKQSGVGIEVGSRVAVRQTRSSNRSNGRNLATLRALGLGRIGRVVEHTLTPSVGGMLRAVSHLIEIEKI